MFTGYGNCYRLDALELTAEPVRNTQHWTYQTLQHFRDVLANPEFPCLFGRKAVNGATCHILFARAEQLADDIAQGLADYVRHIAPIPVKQRIGSPLVVFLETAAESTLADQQALAWKVLRGVHARDPHPWPSSVPTDPDDNGWSFCYAGMPLFINMNFPGHRQMKSRNLGKHITFVINAGKLRRSGQCRHRERPAHSRTHPRSRAPLQRRRHAGQPGLLWPGRQFRMETIPVAGSRLAQPVALPLSCPLPCNT